MRAAPIFYRGYSLHTAQITATKSAGSILATFTFSPTAD